MSFPWTIRPRFCGRMAFQKRIQRGAVSALCALLLSFAGACGPVEKTSPPSAPKPVATGQQAALAPLSVPPQSVAGERPPQPGQSGTTYMPNGLPALQPALGLKPELLFAEKLTDENARFTRLENAVVEMRQEFEAVKPAIVRLAAVEEDMQVLLTQLESLVQNAPPPQDPTLTMNAEEPPTEPVPEAVTQPPVAVEQVTAPPVAIAPPAPESQQEQAEEEPQPVPVIAAPVLQNAASGATVNNIRIGEHEAMTRLVIDLSAPTPYKIDIDNTENFLLIELPDAGWSAPRQGASAAAPLLTSWASQPMNNAKGSHIIFQLRSDVIVVRQDTMSDPDRIVIDLKKM